MKYFALLIALTTLVVCDEAAATHETASPCCEAFDHDSNPSTPLRACNEVAFGSVPSAGCQEDSYTGSCVGGGFRTDGLSRGCVCVGPVCVSALSVPPGALLTGDIGTTPADCAKAAAIACCEAGACH